MGFRKIWLVLFGIALSLAILEVSLRAAGIAYIFAQKQGNAADMQNEYRILTLGESTTAELYNGQSTWPEELESLLNNGTGKFRVINAAVPSVNTDSILANLEDNLQRHRPHMVIAMMGTNDKETYAMGAEGSLGFLEDLRIYKLARYIAESTERYEDPNEGAEELVFNQTEAKLISAIEKDPGNFTAIAHLSILYDARRTYLSSQINHFGSRREYRKQAAAIRKEAEVREKKEMLSGRDYGDIEQRLRSEAESSNYTNYSALIDLEIFYAIRGGYAQQEAVLKKMVGANPGDPVPHYLLGNLYALHTNRSEEGLGEYVIYVNMTRRYDEHAFLQVSKIYMEIGKLADAYEFLKYVERFSPDNPEAKMELAWYYLNTDPLKAEEIFAGVQKANPNYLLEMYGQLAGRFRKAGDAEKAGRMLSRAVEIRANNTITQKNYRKLSAILKERGIRLVAMQYPTLPLGGLEGMLSADVIFASNENFNAALLNASYEEYFVDRARGSWGHATRKGNRLIAENAARAVAGAIKQGEGFS